MVVTDLLLLLSSIVISGVSISIITDAKNARRYHRGGLVVVAARRRYVLLLLSSLFQQFQLSAQARRLGEPMEKLTHWDDAISTRPSFTTRSQISLLLREIRLLFFRQGKTERGALYVSTNASSRF